MSRSALLLGFIPALVAGLLMGSFLNAYPSDASGRTGYDIPKAEYSSAWMEGLDNLLLPAFFIFMILLMLKLIFNIRFVGLFSALLGYAGMIMLMTGEEFYGFLYLFFGGILCISFED